MFKQVLIITGAALFFSLPLAAAERAFEYSFGRPLQTAPAVDRDGTIYVGGEGAVASLTAGGQENWKIELSAGSQARIGGIAVGSDRLYVTSAEGLFAINKEGEKIWTNSISATETGVALEGADGLYVVDTANTLHALRADGTVRWSAAVESTVPLPWGGVVVGPGGTVFTSGIGTLTAFTSSGTELWSTNGGFTTPVVDEAGNVFVNSIEPNRFVVHKYDGEGAETWGTPWLLGAVRAPFVIGPDGSVYVPSTQSGLGTVGLVVLDGDGQEQWRLEAPVSASPAIAADGTVYVATESPELVALNRNGLELWDYPLSGPAVKGVMIGNEGTILVSQANGTLLGVAGDVPLAASIWPAYGGNGRQRFEQRASVLTILPAEGIGTNSAILRGAISPLREAGVVYFEYGPGTNLLQTATQEVAASDETMDISQAIDDLDEGTLYTAWLILSNEFVIERSEAVSFRTLGESEAVPPTLAALQAAATAGGIVKFSADGVIHVSEPIEFQTNAVIDANGFQVVLSGGGGSSLIRVGNGVDLALHGLWMVDGRAAQELQIDNTVSYGGAVVNNGGRLRLVDCVFSNNLAHVNHPEVHPEAPMAGTVEGAGGAIWQMAGELFIEKSLFVSNQVTGTPWMTPTFPATAYSPKQRGGAIALFGGAAEIVNSRFHGNSVPGGQPSEGGAIYSDAAEVVISSSEFTGNSVSHVPRGGAIFVASGRLSLTNSTLNRNVAWASVSNVRSGVDGSAFGGAIYNAGSADVTSSSVLDNQTIGGEGGGLFMAPPGASAGAGIYNASTLAVVNATFSGNSSTASIRFADFPGVQETLGAASALYSSGIAGVTNSTFAFNPKGESSVRGETSTNLVLKNTLLVEKSATPIATAFVDAGHNLSSGAASFTETTSHSNIEARLGPLGFYGGNTAVYPLMAGSAAIDAGDDLAAPGVDQRGRVRPYGTRVDVGAFESSAPFFVWGEIRGYRDPSTSLTVGTEEFSVDSSGFFAIGPLPFGTNEIQFAAEDALFLPNPQLLDVQADQELNGVVSFQLHTLTFHGTGSEPGFMLAGLAGESWRIEMSEDLENWSDVGTYTLDASGLALVPVPSVRAVFLRVTGM